MSEERSIISLHVGQGGVQIGQAVWELITCEHAISPSGKAMNPDQMDDQTFQTFYNLTEKGQYVPRALFLDLEPTCVDEIRAGAYKQLFHPDQLISGLEDAANNFSRGYYTVGKGAMPEFMNKLRRIVEACENCQGFILSHAFGGGTGSGLAALIYEYISANYPKTTKLDVAIYPSPHLSTAVVEPYNSILTTHYSFDHSDVSFLLDNEAIYEICAHNLSVENPSFLHLNRIISQIWSAMTVSFRFHGMLNADLITLQTNLVPYPRIHFPVCNYAPLMNNSRASHQELTVPEITRAVFEGHSQLIKCDITQGKYMSCILMYRGSVTPNEVQKTVNMLKSKNLRFVDWCPTGFKVGINGMPPTVVEGSFLAATPRNVTMLTNNSAVGNVWEALNTKAEMLFSKRAFVHWFVGDGMEEGEINDSIENINALIKDYEECSADSEPAGGEAAEAGEAGEAEE